MFNALGKELRAKRLEGDCEKHIEDEDIVTMFFTSFLILKMRLIKKIFKTVSNENNGKGDRKHASQLNFKKFEASDFHDYFQLVSNKDVMAQITERAIPLEEAQANYEKLLCRNKKYEIYGSYKVKL